MYHYGGNNPIKYTDPTGEAIETAWDLFSLGTGVTSFIDNVKEGNIGGAFLDGVGIVVDAAAVILPGIPGGVGTLIKGTKATEIIQSTEKVNDVGIKAYSTLKKEIKGTGLQAHHLIEKRFANQLNLDPKKMNAITLTKEEHQKFTNAWRQLIPYGTDYTELSVEEIWEVAQNIYAEHPELLKAVSQTLGVE